MTLSGIKFGTLYYKVEKSDSTESNKSDYRQVNDDGTLGNDAVSNTAIATEDLSQKGLCGYLKGKGFIIPDSRSADVFVNSAPIGALVATGKDAQVAYESEGNSLKVMLDRILENLSGK